MIPPEEREVIGAACDEWCTTPKAIHASLNHWASRREGFYAGARWGLSFVRQPGEPCALCGTEAELESGDCAFCAGVESARQREPDVELRKAAQRALDLLDRCLDDEIAPEAVRATAEAALDLRAALSAQRAGEPTWTEGDRVEWYMGSWVGEVVKVDPALYSIRWENADEPGRMETVRAEHLRAPRAARPETQP